MEQQKDDNLHILEAVVQNTEMGKNTLAQILPMTEDARFKAELIRQRSGYQELNQEAHAGLDACGGRGQGEAALAQMDTRGGVGIRHQTDRHTPKQAGEVSDGRSRRGEDCIKCQKDYPGAAPGTRRLMQRLQAFEEDNRQKLQQFL